MGMGWNPKGVSKHPLGEGQDGLQLQTCRIWGPGEFMMGPGVYFGPEGPSLDRHCPLPWHCHLPWVQ